MWAITESSAGSDCDYEASRRHDFSTYSLDPSLQFHAASFASNPERTFEVDMLLGSVSPISVQSHITFFTRVVQPIIPIPVYDLAKFTTDTTAAFFPPDITFRISTPTINHGQHSNHIMRPKRISIQFNTSVPRKNRAIPEVEAKELDLPCILLIFFAVMTIILLALSPCPLTSSSSVTKPTRLQQESYASPMTIDSFITSGRNSAWCRISSNSADYDFGGSLSVLIGGMEYLLVSVEDAKIKRCSEYRLQGRDGSE